MKLADMKSNATNAYDLLSDVRACILAEPLRIDMDSWLTQVEDTTINETNNELPAPACGTIGCIGGWTEILAYGHSRKFGTEKSAQFLLGDSSPDAPAKYKRDLDDLFFEWDTKALNSATYGTPAYATQVADTIAAFQEKYAAFLKSITL